MISPFEVEGFYQAVFLILCSKQDSCLQLVSFFGRGCGMWLEMWKGYCLSHTYAHSVASVRRDKTLLPPKKASKQSSKPAAIQTAVSALLGLISIAQLADEL